MIYTDFHGEKLSLLGFGTMRLPLVPGGTPADIDEKTTADMVRYAMEHGVNYFDTAYPYHGGMSERVMGRVLKDYDRGSFYLATKYPGHQLSSHYDPAAIFEEQLEKCGVDYFDFYLLHNVYEKSIETYMDPRWGIIDYFLEQKKKGVIRHIGMSTHNPAMAKKAVESGIVEMILFSINPAFDLMPPTEDLNAYFAEQYDEHLGGMDPIRAELYKLCESRNIGITVMKGYAGGRLFDAVRSPFGVALTPVQCIHYVLTRPAVAAIMVGVDNPQHVLEAVAYETASEGEKDYATVLANAPRHAYTGQCTYCGHCKPCPMEIDIAMVNKLYDLAAMQDKVPQSIQAHYDALEHKASECVGCGGCETRCPFHVKISERMKRTATLLG